MPKYAGPSRPGSPIKISRSGPSLSHLLFADDILLLGKATLDNCNTIVGILDEFLQASGQKINFGKSKVIFWPTLSIISRVRLPWPLMSLSLISLVRIWVAQFTMRDLLSRPFSAWLIRLIES